MRRPVLLGQLQPPRAIELAHHHRGATVSHGRDKNTERGVGVHRRREKRDLPIDQLVTVHNAFRGFIPNTECSVLMRLDNEYNSNFNQYIKDNNLNNSLDKSTKVVYIRSNKIPKPLLKLNWNANSVLLLNSHRVNNDSLCYLNMCDLVVHYDTTMSQFMRLQRNGIEEL